MSDGCSHSHSHERNIAQSMEAAPALGMAGARLA